MAQIKTKFIEDLAITTGKITDNAVDGDKVADDVALAGNPTTTTQTAGNDSTRIATTAFVKAAVDANAAGLAWKQPVRLASGANIASLTSITASDFDGTGQGITLATNDRVLLKDQSTGSQNGLYEYDGADLIRTSDMDGGSEAEGAAVFVQEGDEADNGFTQTADSVTIGSDAMTWVQFNGAANIIAGDGLDKSGNTLSVDLKASGGLKIDTTELAVEPNDFAGTGLEDDGSDNLRLASQGNGIAGGAGSTLSADPATEVAGSRAAVYVGADGIGIELDNSTLDHSSSTLQVKALGIDSAQLAADSVTAAKLAADTAGDGLTQAAGGELDLNLAAAGGLETSTDQLQVNIDASNSSTAINGSNELTALRAGQEILTLSGGDITNQYVDLAETCHSAASITLSPVGGPDQEQAVDYTVSLAGGAGGVTRITFAGDLATGGDAALVATDKLIIKYEYM